MAFLRTLLLASLGCISLLTTRANDPGGGVSGVGAGVTLATTTSTVTVGNGVIAATITKSTGKITSYTLNGTQMVDPSGQIYYSMDGGSSYEQPTNCAYAATVNTSDMVDVSFERTWSAGAGYIHAFDIELHYVLRRGDTGLYAYAILEHPAAYPATAVGEWRMVWKLPHDSVNFTFERAYVDALRNWQMPSYYDFTHSTATGIAEVALLTTGVRAGKYDCKYEYAAEYQVIGCWGHASNTAKKGVWMVLGGYDYLNDGPVHQDLTIAESYSLLHFGRNHFGGSSTSVAAGEAWKKFFGPYLLYCNSTTTATNAGNALWADAQAQVAAEINAWPYSWLSHADYPAASGRGTVTGTFIVNDALKPSVSGANAWVGLAAPEDSAGNWQNQSKGYQFWVHADGAGNFNIPDVRPGSYTLYAFADGAVGEFTKTLVTVTAGATTALGTQTWVVPHSGTSIAWEIGTPNRSAKEFRHGTDYYEPYLWEIYSLELPSPLEYTIGTSTPASGWNYAHSGHLDAGVWTPWKWRVNFNLPAIPASGQATLTIAFAGSESARIDLYVNNEASLFARFYPPGDGGNNLIREGIHGKYGVSYVSIPVSALHVGTNTITFIEGRTGSATEHVMYDYLSLELPPFPPLPPTSGRSIVWKGGTTAAANTWDTGTTLSFLDGATTAAFGTGDAVTFDTTGSNTTNVTLTGSIEPNSVTFSGTKNYTLAGAGALTGQMPLTKSGTGNLTINATQTFAGPTTISGGKIILANDPANSGGLGTSAVTLMGGTLAMHEDFSSYNSASWDINVPGGFSGTLNADSRCDLYGKLTGAGTFNLFVPDIRTTLFGDWSGFSGQVNVTADAGGGEFRMGTSYTYPGLPNAALNLGAGVLASFVGTPSSGLGTTIPIGELTGPATSTLRGAATGGRITRYRIGGRGTDAIFAGNIGEQNGTAMTSMTKAGAGTWTLSGTCNWTGTTSVEAGKLLLTGSLTTPGDLEVLDSATFQHTGSGAFSLANLHVADGGILEGAVVLSGDLNNEGTVSIPAGAALQVAGNLTNTGTLRLHGTAALLSTGTLTNNGLFDLMTWTGALPAGFVNNGTVLDRSLVKVTSVTRSGGDFTVVVEGYTGHTYQLQSRDSLGSGGWSNVGTVLSGTDSPLALTQVGGGSGAQRYYRVLVGP